SCNSGDYAAGARQLRRILDEVIEARTAPAAGAKTPPPAADTKTPPPAADTGTPPPRAETKTPSPVAPRRPDADRREIHAKPDDSIKPANRDAAFAEKSRRQRAGADQSCNSGDYAAGARQLRRILDEVIEARTAPAAETKTPPPAAETKAPPPAADATNRPRAAQTRSRPPVP